MDNLEGFRALGISECILAALQKKGFENPSPIQQLTIPLLLKGEKDVVGQAQTGTGKTAAFGIPVIDTVHGGGKFPQALVLSPTRELSIQIAEELNSLQGDSRLRIAPFYGGQYIGVQLKKLQEGVDIVIGTPGRIIDLIERGKLILDHLQFAVLDEADEMLDMGFVDDIRQILEQTPADKRMLMFSATMPKEILAIAEQFMRPDYEIVRTQTQQTPATTELTDQFYYVVRREQKLEALSRLIDIQDDLYGMVFCKTRTDVDELAEQLAARGCKVDLLHGDIPQAQRLRVINGFKARKFNLLIATDVAARGIDINDLTHVINYSIPQSAEIYVHRIGRTGRAGKRGTAITLVTPGEVHQLGRIQKTLRISITKGVPPTVDQVLSARKQHFSGEICRMIGENEHADYLSFAEELLTLADHPAEVLAAMLKMRFRDELLPQHYHELTPQKARSEEYKSFARVRLKLGRETGITVPEILELIFRQTGVKGCQLGHIDCVENYTYINAPGVEAAKIVEVLGSTELEAVPVPTNEGVPPKKERVHRFEQKFRRQKKADFRHSHDGKPGFKRGNPRGKFRKGPHPGRNRDSE